MATVVRTGSRTFLATSDSGVEIAIGNQDQPGHVRPTELLRIALAACGALSAEFTLSRRLGDDYGIEIEVTGDKSDENRIPAFIESTRLDLSGLDEDARAKLERAVASAMTLGCTVERTLSTSATVTHTIESAPVTRVQPASQSGSQLAANVED